MGAWAVKRIRSPATLLLLDTTPGMSQAGMAVALDWVDAYGPSKARVNRCLANLVKHRLADKDAGQILPNRQGQGRRQEIEENRHLAAVKWLVDDRDTFASDPLTVRLDQRQELHSQVPDILFGHHAGDLLAEPIRRSPNELLDLFLGGALGRHLLSVNGHAERERVDVIQNHFANVTHWLLLHSSLTGSRNQSE